MGEGGIENKPGIFYHSTIPAALSSSGNMDITEVESAFEEQAAKVCSTLRPRAFFSLKSILFLLSSE